ncbi:MAG: hypothetical protein K0R54_2601 [Clostridiaceae bacterium]|jgi:hypothetical protein|nr:hypothetical protein [Clostridiaceae bacterium]
MIFKYGNTCIAGDLNNNFHKFYIESNTLITENITDSFTNKLSYRKNVVDFSVDVDVYNNIHIIYLTNRGILMHSIFSSASRDEMITKVDSNTHFVKYVKLKIVLDKINIFYMMCSIENVHSWSLNHIYFKNCVWNNTLISNINVSHRLFSYIIDTYRENLYILYSPNSDYYFKIQYSNNRINNWVTMDSNIYIECAENANFFITPSGTGFINYFENNSNSIIKYKNFNLPYECWCGEKYIYPDSMNFIVF